MAVVEAKEEGKLANTGLEQAKRYARDLGLAFAYATNGHGVVEYDFFTHSSRDLDTFPSPDELWQRWRQEHKESVRYFDLTFESLLTRVILPPENETRFVDMMMEQLGLTSLQDPLVDFL